MCLRLRTAEVNAAFGVHVKKRYLDSRSLANSSVKRFFVKTNSLLEIVSYIFCAEKSDEVFDRTFAQWHVYMSE